MDWSFKNIVGVVENVVDPSAAALRHGEQVVTWGALKTRSDALAAGLHRAGLQHGDKVAHYLRNRPEYLETSMACFKAGLVHVNVNYRYTANELFHIFDNSDAAAIVYEPEFAEQIAALRPRLGKVKAFIETGAETPRNHFADAFGSLASTGAAAPETAATQGDFVFIYTGGTTGLPKGVMWRQGDLWAALGGGGPAPGLPGPPTLEAFADLLRAGQGGMPVLVCPPLMHGAGYLIALSSLLRGGCVITCPGAGFDPHAALSAIAAGKPRIVVIVGDAFARPLLRALETSPGAHDLSSVMMIISSGAVWSPDVKAGLARHLPGAMLMDSLGSSEVLGMGSAIASGEATGQPTRFIRDPRTKVIDDEGREVEPGSGQIGRIHRGGPAPIGYYKDPEKSAMTFVEIDGQRYVVPGDYATVDSDGAVRLIGRGSQVINTGGEKVFVEEVEAALKSHAAVEDALVFGVSDPQWGQAVTAVVELAAPVDEAALQAHVRSQLAGYKAPKRIVFVDKAPRGPNGKANYEAARALAAG